ncbi:hypothetical protein ACE2PP_004003 [Salmonella enterica]|nr:hypothetical protein [Salmonella enterica subsp. enterica serovar Edinburgh]EBH8908861.1 hypothetical protein [Salmonella enterica subsp. enterica serovar Santiago]EJX4578549.1 hypothetical protein [Salmonella enterica]EBH8969249.1 hypothetical protein [Salmonella enterica subsp. enterica serovar Santiago]EKP2045256.1 hypothetical protein [Salmonella enterica]
MSEFNETQPGNKLYSYLLDEDNKYRLDTLANAVTFILTLCDESKECQALADGMQAKGVTAIFEILDKEIDGIKNSVYATGLEFSPDRIASPQFGKGR